MQTKTQEVKMQVETAGGKKESKVVGTAQYFEYETASEAIEHLGEEKLLEALNAQIRTNEMNRVRGLARGGPSKKALQSKALASLTLEDFASVAGNKEAIDALIAQRMDEIEAEEKAKVGVAVGADAE